MDQLQRLGPTKRGSSSASNLKSSNKSYFVIKTSGRSLNLREGPKSNEEKDWIQLETMLTN